MNIVTITGVDPGPVASGWVQWNVEDVCVTLSDKEIPNQDLLDQIRDTNGEEDHVLAIEKVQHYGKTVGEPTFETIYWTGRFMEAWYPGPAYRIPWRDVAKCLCDTTYQVKETHVRRATIDIFGPDEKATIGNKKSPGRLYGVSGHAWSALAVAFTWMSQNGKDLRSM